jgi:hypothetical protein
MPSFSMRPAKYFYDKPLPKYLDPKTVLIYLPHPVHFSAFLILWNNQCCSIITIKVADVYMARVVMILIWATSIARALVRGAP